MQAWTPIPELPSSNAHVYGGSKGRRNAAVTDMDQAKGKAARETPKKSFPCIDRAAKGSH